MGGSGGGGSSGQVDYPFEMKICLYNWLYGKDSDGEMTDELTTSVTEALNNAAGNSPFASAVAYDPDTDLDAMATAVTNFNTIAAALDHIANYNTAWTGIDDNYPLATPTQRTATLDSATFDSTRHDADIEAFSDILDDIIDDVEIPKFQAGMLNIGAVNTSAFVIGEALIRAYKGRDLTKYGTGLRAEIMKQVDEHNMRFKISRREIQKDYDIAYEQELMQYRIHREQTIAAATQVTLANLMRKTEFLKDVMHMTMEKNRMSVIAKQEETAHQLEYDEADARWYLESFQYAANVMAAIGGGTATRNAKKPNMAASALSGAIAGAAAGTAIYPGIGTAVGAIVGAAGGALGAS